MSDKKFKIKINKKDLPKKRIPIAPPNQPHKDKSKYDRKKNKKIEKQERENES
jgi:hypothetical protein